MSSARALRLFACVLSLSLAAGCGDACLSLAAEICNCQPDDNSRAICNAQASQQEAAFPVRAQDKAFCQQKLDSHACDCSSEGSTAAYAACCGRLNTPEGRAACGLTITSP